VSRTLTIAGYSVLIAAMACYQVAAILWHRNPSLGDAVAYLTRSRIGRWALLGGWLWLGWHLFVRANWG
jgi:hypothetical protein